MKDINEQIENRYLSDPRPMNVTGAYEELRPAERLFVDAYLSELNMSAVAAGQSVIDHVNSLRLATEEQRYNARFKVAHWHANEMMKKPLVRSAISERLQKISYELEISAYRIITELKHTAFANIGDYWSGFNGDGLPVWDLSRASRDQLSAIESVETEYDKDGAIKKVKVKMHSKNAAVEKLMKYFGMLDGEGRAMQQPAAPATVMKEITATTSTAAAADLYAATLRGV